MLIDSRDITERKLAQEVLQKTKAELESFFDVALDMLCITDVDGLPPSRTPSALIVKLLQ